MQKTMPIRQRAPAVVIRGVFIQKEEGEIGRCEFNNCELTMSYPTHCDILIQY
jgi:hypothetical protein